MDLYFTLEPKLCTRLEVQQVPTDATMQTASAVMFHGPLSAIVSEHGRVTSAGHFILTAPKTSHPYKPT